VALDLLSPHCNKTTRMFEVRAAPIHKPAPIKTAPPKIFFPSCVIVHPLSLSCPSPPKLQFVHSDVHHNHVIRVSTNLSESHVHSLQPPTDTIREPTPLLVPNHHRRHHRRCFIILSVARIHIPTTQTSYGPCAVRRPRTRLFGT
jgi:hypothetical protein